MGLIVRKVLGRIIGGGTAGVLGKDNLPVWWDSQFARGTINQNGRPAAGGSPKNSMRVMTTPQFASGFTLDSDRDWTSPYQDITVHFDAMMADPALIVGGTATGHTIKVNAVAQTTTYRSGSGNNKWVFRIPILVHKGDTITWSYDPTVGATVTVFLPAVELPTEVNQQVENYLFEYIRFVLMDSTCTAIASETVKIAIDAYDSGVATNSNWMLRRQFGLTTTDGVGQISLLYNGVENPGDTVYVTVIRPNTTPTQSMVWTTTVQ
jgi:hypothetical protein